MAKKPKTIEAALLQSARTVAKRLRDHPHEERALFMAAMFAALCDGLPRTPKLPTTSLRALAADDRASVRGVLYGMWREMVAHKALTPSRASILATRLAVLDTAPVVLLLLAHEARALGCVEAADILVREHAAFAAHAATLKIDRAVLDALHLDISHVRVQWHLDGHLASLSNAKRTLTLDATPGRGHYVEEGKRVGYGFAVDEHYERGAVRGTFNSPWHDGEEYADEQPWLSWVSACMVTVLSG